MKTPTFYLGQLIRCIDDSDQFNPTVTILGDNVVAGREYIIRGISRDKGFLLMGVIGGYHWNGWETGFLQSRFVPAETIQESRDWSEDLLEKLEKEIKQEECPQSWESSRPGDSKQKGLNENYRYN